MCEYHKAQCEDILCPGVHFGVPHFLLGEGMIEPASRFHASEALLGRYSRLLLGLRRRIG